jgi:hypothetical protein
LDEAFSYQSWRDVGDMVKLYDAAEKGLPAV